MNGQNKQGQRKFTFFALCTLMKITVPLYKFSLPAVTEISIYFFNTTHSVKHQCKWGTRKQVVQAVIQGWLRGYINKYFIS